MRFVCRLSEVMHWHKSWHGTCIMGAQRQR